MSDPYERPKVLEQTYRKRAENMTFDDEPEVINGAVWWGQIRVTPGAFAKGSKHVLNHFDQEVAALRKHLAVEAERRPTVSQPTPEDLARAEQVAREHDEWR